jgi:uncharacterized protein
MRDIILEWQDNWIPEYISRYFDITNLNRKVNKVLVLTGCRRSGKTFLMFQMIDELVKKHGIKKECILYLNFEDERLPWKTETLTQLLPTLYEIYGDREYYLFLDEIHHIPNWDRWVRRIIDGYRDLHIILASSSSKLGKKEIPNALRGRTSVQEIFPLSFWEFLGFKGLPIIDPKKTTQLKLVQYKKILKEFLEYGGFPAVVLETSRRDKISIIQDYFRTIVALDLAERYDIQNRRFLHDYMQMLLVQTYHSASKMYKIMKSQGYNIGKRTFLSCPRNLEEIYMAFFVPIFSPKVKDRLYYPQKVYFIDNSFINLVSAKFSDQFGKGFENVVFLNLLRTWGFEGIYYWKEKNKEVGSGLEVDFLLMKRGEVECLIQACYDISNEATKEREIQGLLAASKEIQCDNLVIVTLDQQSVETHEGKKILIIPFMEWSASQIKGN